MQEFCSSDVISDSCAQPNVNTTVPPPDDVTCVHRVYDHVIPEDMLDADAVKVVRRLDRFGHESYFVGGSVRDILLGIRPKDFDIATSALPAEVKREFRNCRLIGRRFRLAHLLFKNNKIVEVATFRRSATSDDDVSFRHAAENLFGGPADDAVRRDFTINALMYDVARHRIHDYVGGMADIEARLLNTIGDPARRFREDPVRIIRAVKFAERLELTMHPKVREAALTFAPLVAECAPARLVEELYKIFRTGKSARCFEELERLGVLQVLMPKLSERASSDPERAFRYLEKADRLVKDGRNLSEAVMSAAIIFPFASDVLDEKGDTASKVHALFQEITQPIPFPKRCAAAVRQIINAQKRLFSGPHRAKAKRILDREYALEAIDFMEIIADDEAALHTVSEWRRLIAKGRGQKADRTPASARRHRPRRRKPRRGDIEAAATGDAINPVSAASAAEPAL